MSRRALLTAATTSGLIALTACSSPRTEEEREAERQEEARSFAAEPGSVSESAALNGEAAGLAAALSALLVQRSPVAILTSADPARVEAAATLASQGHWPVLVAEPGEQVPEATQAELTRLGVEHVIVVGPAPTATGSPTSAAAESPGSEASGAGSAEPLGLSGVEVHVVPGSASPVIPDDLTVGAAPEPVAAAVVGQDDPVASAALATAAAFGAGAHTGIEDPREDSAVMESLRAQAEAPIVTLGADAESAERLLVMSTMAQRAPELPGGGVTVFPHRRMVALYGHPGAPVLGLLGEQDIEGSIKRVNTYVEKYTPLVDETVVPSWEIIASVATGAAGPDGNYSKVWEVELFRPWVDAAKEAGIYVVLDLQPGRSDFLTQAKEYEELLIEPHVGLALDPEWRLGPNEKHLVRIGHVEAEEINQVSEWLAGLVREHNLPQKVLTLHQFQLRMIRGRENVRTDHPELAIVLHADGQGGQGAKQDTWRVLKQDLPEGMWLGWKNFYDEDSPMLTPEQTIDQVDPTPWFISYQ